MAYQPTTAFGWAMPRGGDQAQISVINQMFTAKADEIVYQTRRMIAPGYIDDGSKTYQPGEIVEYENVDYVCTGTTSGAWDSSKWDATDMATQIQEAKESGGTNVIANPSAPATEDLNKLQVENTVYGIPDPTVTKEVQSATGTQYVEFTDGADAPLVKCTTTIQGYQEGTGTPSPDNVRPIHAYTQSTISVGGKNRLPSFPSTQTINGVVWTLNDDKSVTLSGGTGSGSMSSYDFGRGTLTLEPGTYTTNTQQGVVDIVVYDNGTYPATMIQNHGGTFTISEKKSVFVRIFVPVSTTISSPITVYPQLVKGSQFGTYEPYNATDHVATFSSSIYQGNADFVVGTVRSTWGSYTFTGSEAWTQQSGVAKYYSNEYLVATTAKLPTTNTNAVQLDTPIGIFTEPYTGLESKTYSMCISRDGRIGITADIYADISMLTGMTVWFELATPTTETITPTNLPIKSLFGYNHIESSTGDMELEYITQTYQPIVDLIDSSKHVYSTAEQVVGKWIDGSDVYEKTIVTEFNNAVPQYTLDLSAIGGDTTMPIYVSHSVLEAMEGSTPIKQITMPAATNSTYSSVSVQHQSSVVTGKSYIKVRYIKLTSNNRSLSKGSTDWLKADLSEEKKEVEELPETEEKTVKEAQSEGEEVTEKVEEPVEEPTEKEENER